MRLITNYVIAMPLFDIPGWSVSIPSTSDPSSSSSRKRKRSSDETQKSPSKRLDLDKLVKTLDGNSSGSIQVAHPKKRKLTSFLTATVKAGKQKDANFDATETRKALLISQPRPLQAASKRAHKSKAESISDTSTSRNVPSKPESLQQGLTQLQQGMRQSLDGARFRLINESLYKSSSHEAHEMMKENPRMFEDYHAGFRHQVQSWPTNPVDHYETLLSAYPPKTVIADLGCGDAALARLLAPKGMIVLSYDIVPDGMFVIEADICERIPLPGSEGTEDIKSSGEGQVIDVVVCSLSLMTTNWPNCIREAWRILKPGGELKIAEVASRLTDTGEFKDLVNMIGFQLRSMDDRNSHFTLFEFKKVPRKSKTHKEWRKVLAGARLLIPCEYKRR